MGLDTECCMGSWCLLCWLRKIEASLQALVPISLGVLLGLHIEETLYQSFDRPISSLPEAARCD
jgi:hypothetical protein